MLPFLNSLLMNNRNSISDSNISFLQNNTRRTSAAMTSALQIAYEQKTDFVLMQEISINMELNLNTVVSHSAYYCILSEVNELRPRVAIYARKRSRFQAVARYDIISDNDILIIDIIDSKKELETIQLVNIYNEKSLRENDNRWTIERCLLKYTPQKYSIITGDFNAHHVWWNSARTNQIRAEKLVEYLINYDFTLINEAEK